MRVVQINLHRSRAASAALCRAMESLDIALIQEPWTNKQVIRGLGSVEGTLIYDRSSDRPRTAILVKKNFQVLPLTLFCSRDLVAVRITNKKGSPKDFVIGSAYLPYDDPKPPPTEAVERLVKSCR